MRSMANIVASRRQAMGLSQKALGKKVRMSQSHISQIECGLKTNLRWDVFRRLARGLGVWPSTLLGGKQAGGPVVLSTEKLGQRIRRLRLAAGLQLRDCGIDGNWLCAIESGRQRYLETQTIQTIAAGLGVPVAELVD